MDTKQRILDEALTLFSEKGYANVYVADIAEKVGIKAPSLYKHYKSKQAIFDAIIDEMSTRFVEQARSLNIQGNDAGKDAEIYKNITEDELVGLGMQLFGYFLHDDQNRKFRKMLTLEQFRDEELAKTYSKIYVDDPLTYQGMLFGIMAAQGILCTDNVPVMTIHFYAPVYYFLTICDREPAREKEVLVLLEEHIRQFNKLYGRKAV